MLQLVRPLVQDCLAIASAMPPDEQRQYLATVGAAKYDAQDAARAMLTMPGETHCIARRDGQSVAIGGYQRHRPGVWQAWMVAGADVWATYGCAITRLARAMHRHMLERGDCHRLEVLATRERTHAHHWYVEGLGMELEGPRRRYFADGADALVFVQFPQES